MRTRILLSVLVLVAIVYLTSGCQTMREHPRISAFVAGSLVLTAGGALRHSRDEPTHSFAPPICSTKPEACR